jgi:hypothetical protein
MNLEGEIEFSTVDTMILRASNCLMSYLPVQAPASHSDHMPSVVIRCAYSDTDGKLATPPLPSGG